MGDFLLGNCTKNYTTKKHVIEFLYLWLTCITLTVEKNEAFKQVLEYEGDRCSFSVNSEQEFDGIIYTSNKVKKSYLTLAK